VVPLVKRSFVAPFVVTKTYVLVPKKDAAYSVLLVRIVDTTIEYLWQFGRYGYIVTNYMVTRDYISVTEVSSL
jgi:hypothetical protein